MTATKPPGQCAVAGQMDELARLVTGETMLV